MPRSDSVIVGTYAAVLLADLTTNKPQNYHNTKDSHLPARSLFSAAMREGCNAASSDLHSLGISRFMKNALRFKAGPRVFERIHKEGFRPEQIGTLAGASGGAKWLVLSQLDRVIIERILPQLVGPVHLIGSSVGAWRFSCYAQAQPQAALQRFEDAYVEQRYSADPGIDEITARSEEIIAEIMGSDGVKQVATNPVFRAHIMTVRCGLLTASESKPLLAASLMLAATANFVSRRTLGAFFDRALFYDQRDLPPFYNSTGFPIERIALTEDNYTAAVMASGAIPLVLRGVRDISGAPPGVYRDGGIIDYHLDLQTSVADRITLFPHFFDHLIPGWFDKKLSWRNHRPEHIENTLLVCPSAEFVAALPNGKIPDRTDFVTMSQEKRGQVWRQVVASCEALAEDFHNVLDKGDMPARLEPL